MKIYKVHKLVRGAALMGAATLAVIGCSREVEMEIPGEAGNGAMAVQDGSEGNVRTVHFRAVQAETRAQFGEKEGDAYPTLWTENDTKVKLSLNYGGALTADVEPSEDYRTATFSADVVFPQEGPYTFYSVSPASAALALSPSREAWKVSIPCEQTPTAGSVDEAGIIIAATSEEFSSATDVSNVNLAFNHLTAYGRMTLTNLSNYPLTVSAVELTTTTPIVGDWYWETSGNSITDYGASSTLLINTSSLEDIWFACSPVSVDDQMMTVSVYTNLGDFSKDVSFPANGKFEAGQVAVFAVDMQDAVLSTTSASDPILQESDYGCYLGYGLSRKLSPGTDQVTRSYDENALTYTILNPSTLEELKITGYTKLKLKGDTVDVTVDWRQGFDLIHFKTYSMKVVKEEGPKVWLGDGTGKGFIIKK